MEKGKDREDEDTDKEESHAPRLSRAPGRARCCARGPRRRRQRSRARWPWWLRSPPRPGRAPPAAAPQQATPPIWSRF